jgi:hypothetical protein
MALIVKIYEINGMMTKNTKSNTKELFIMNFNELSKYKSNFIVIIFLLLFSFLTACGSKDALDNNVPVVSQNETQEGVAESTNEEENIGEAMEVEPSITPNGSEDKASEQVGDTAQGNEAAIDREARLNAYQSVLIDIYENHIFPDGQASDWSEGTDMAQNQFAVYDIDQDGKDELILIYSTASMAGMVELIYDFDNNTKTSQEEFREFPALTFYDNGIIQADWSHNQGLAGEFWPFNLYQYNSETDRYDNVAMVDAWDRSLSETDYNGNPFPVESDTDGDGVVYYIMKDGEYKLDTPVDGAEYEQWRSTYLNNANEVDIPFVDLTEDNIHNIQ